jgi:hypothetical protein
MKKVSMLALLISTALLSACGNDQTNVTVTAEAPAEATTAAPVINQELNSYKAGAEELVSMIREAKPDTDIAAKSADLVSSSRAIIKQFMVKHPNCTEYLTALDQAADIIPTLPLEEIETGYHQDGKLPQFDDPNCYHAKDLLVHAATVQAMATMGIEDDAMRTSAENEIIEVIAHFSQVESALN